MTPRVRLITALLSCALALVTIWVMLNMATDAKAQPPRGGCAMAFNHPHSAGADWCRDHGWTIAVNQRTGKGVILSPHRVLRYLFLPDCRGGTIPCYRVNAGPQELDFYVSGLRVHFFWSPSPLVGHRQWQWVDQPLADALAEGGYPHATTRNWEACAVKFRIGADRIKCPDGLHFSI